MSKVLLSKKHKKFADYYVETGNAAEAYLHAGYIAKNTGTAASGGSRLLKNTDIVTYINERIEKKDSKKIAKQDEILQLLTKIVRGEMVEKIPLGVGGGLQSLTDNVPTIKDRIRAAELLGKRYMMWVDKQQIDATVSVQIVDDIGSDEDDENQDIGED